MHWSEIPGWFDWQDLYTEVAEKATDDSVLIEVGCWRGRSLAFLASECLRLEKSPSIYAVDTWAGSVGEPALDEQIDQLGGPDGLYRDFLDNMRGCGVAHLITPLRLSSLEAARIFEPAEADFVFVDASHDFQSVCSDVRAWRTRVKPGGALAGHDVHLDSVSKAIATILGPFGIRGSCWWRAI